MHSHDLDDPGALDGWHQFCLNRALDLMAEWEDSGRNREALIAAQTYAGIAQAVAHRLDLLGGVTADPPALCRDCGVDVAPGDGENADWQWFIVRDDVWAAAAMTDGFLCVACLQNRLGRELTGSDFDPTIPVNRPLPGHDLPALLELKLAAARGAS